MTAHVRRVRKFAGVVPQWLGGRMPLSSELARGVRRKLDEARLGKFEGTEMRAVRVVLEVQNRWSRIPGPDELLIERVSMRDGVHHFLFPFAGRLAHEGLASLVAYRISQLVPASISVTINDYGFGLLTATPIDLEPHQWKRAFSAESLLEDLLACLNSAELARRQFREIARIAGLVFQGYPGAAKATRQLQASSSLFYEVFAQYDPQNLLLDQARREVLDRQLEIRRITQTATEIGSMKTTLVPTERLSPLSFPLWASFVQANVSSEKWADRVRRMALSLETIVAEESS